MSAAQPPAADPSAPHPADRTSGPTDVPPLNADPSFWALLVTQFLGAFNDNVFKQLVLLICLDYKLAGNTDYQDVAQGLFALPFVLLSGLWGWLADRWPKRAIVVGCKVAEIVIMLLGAAALWAGGDDLGRLVALLLAVLALMGAQSAAFGPSKYGVLPELFRGGDLPRANGWVQMTTFLAIILGIVTAGKLKAAGAELWVVGACCVGIAVAGTVSSLFLRRTPIAEPNAPFEPSALVIHRSLWALLKSDKTLTGVLLASTLFWLVGGLVLPAINALGKVQLGLGDDTASYLAAAVAVGIGAGCALAGKLSGDRVRFGLVRLGAAGIALACAAVTAVGYLGIEPGPALWMLYPLMGVIGVASGLFAVPLQVFLQARPPVSLKGRMIGAMNFVNWCGILAAAGLYAVVAKLADGPVDAPNLNAADPDAAYHWLFAAAAALMLPVALFYRPADTNLGAGAP